MNVWTSTIEIDASASLVWEVFSDVERWPEWTTSVTRLVSLDGPAIAVGKRFEIKQPRLPRLVWEVTEVVPGASWTWVQRSAGGLIFTRHESSPRPAAARWSARRSTSGVWSAACKVGSCFG